MEESERGKILLWVGGAAMAVILLLIAVVVARDGDLMARFGGRKTPDSIEREMESVAELQPMLRALRGSYPEAHRRLLEEVADASNRGGQAAAEEAAGRFMRAFMLSKIEAMAGAPSQELHGFLVANLRLMEAMRREDVQLCAHYAMSALPPGRRLPAELVRLTGAVNEAQIRAARAGESERRVERGPLRQADAVAWLRRVGSIDARAAELISQDRLSSAPASVQCEAGVASFRAAADLPPDQGAAIAVEVLRGAARTLR